jgi:hypothetical protein
MSKPFSSVLFAAWIFCGIPTAPAQSPPEAMRNLVPDVERPRKTDRTYVFSRSQWKYGIKRDDYLNLWIDRPLYVNPSHDEDSEGRDIDLPSFLRAQEDALRYKLDGLAFFPETSRRSTVYAHAARQGLPEFKLLTEFISPSMPTTKAQVLQMAGSNPHSFRIDGKLVITSYNADALPVAAWQKTLAELRAGNPEDSFLFLPALTRFGNRSLGEWNKRFHQGTITEKDVEGIKEGLRQWLRISDGLCFASAASVKDATRRFDDAFYRDFLIRIMRSVLAEPEFHSKYLALSALVGHENVTRSGYTHSSDGTKTLRKSLEAAIEAEPEIINIPEWDEQNENTSLRPTIYNGTSSLRIVRHYITQLRKEPLTPLPGDNTEVPNLIVSYRKVLTLGETLDIEILYVPDGTNEKPFTAQLTLEDPVGKTVFESPELSFSGTALQDHTIRIASETLGDHPVLLPRLKTIQGDRTLTFGNGLHYIDLRATSNWDYKWVKQPLRDLFVPKVTEFSVQPSGPDGLFKVHAKIESDEPLAYVEVLDNDDVVYSHSKDATWREDENEVVISLRWQSTDLSSRPRQMAGDIVLEGATGRWLIPKAANAPVALDNTLTRFKSSLRPQRILLAIPRAEVDKASLSFNLEGLPNKTIPVTQLLTDSPFALSGPGRMTLVASRYLRQFRMPDPLGETSCAFDVLVSPDQPNSIFHLQAETKSGRIFRSGPIRLNPGQGGQTDIVVFSETKGTPTTVKVATDRVPVLDYRFQPDHGSALVTSAGRAYHGTIGDFTSLTTERGGGQSGDGTPFYEKEHYPADAPAAAPAWGTEENGEHALHFDGKGNYLVLPQGAIPRRAGFTVSMDIWPEASAGRQVIFSNRANYPGSLTIALNNGALEADFLSERGESTEAAKLGLSLPPGRWSHLVIRYDQRKLTAAVDGRDGTPVTIEGPGIYDTVTAVGGFGKNWFAGKIKNLRVTHTPWPEMVRKD